MTFDSGEPRLTRCANDDIVQRPFVLRAVEMSTADRWSTARLNAGMVAAVAASRIGASTGEG